MISFCSSSGKATSLEGGDVFEVGGLWGYQLGFQADILE
jgi:hypothetical protein